MGPKEKAIELVDRYFEYLHNHHYIGLNISETMTLAKQCALICQNEKIDSFIKIRRLIPILKVLEFIKKEKELQEVKQEIEKL